MLKTRVFTVALLLPLFLAALFYLPTAGWVALNLVVMTAAASEWACLARLHKPAARFFIAAVLLLLLVMVPLLDLLDQHPTRSRINLSMYALALAFWVAAAPFWLRSKWQAGKLGLSLVGALVLISTWLALVQLREIDKLLILWIFSVVWVADIGAYFCGKKFGRHPLAPNISPGKTWEGVGGAVLAVTAYALALVISTGNHGIGLLDSPLPAYAVLLVHWVLTVLSIVGDLFESLLKRQAGVKDSGTMLPGHGGVLDRIDGLTSTLPVAAFFIFVMLR